MPCHAIHILNRFEALVKTEKIKGFNIVLQQNGFLVKSDDGSRELTVELDRETLSSLKVFFIGADTIQHDSFDYTNLCSIINAKSILERMLHNKSNTE